MEKERLWSTADLAHYLGINDPHKIRQMILEGKITEADGWRKVGKLNRFIKRVVVQRCEAGLFGRGLD